MSIFDRYGHFLIKISNATYIVLNCPEFFAATRGNNFNDLFLTQSFIAFKEPVDITNGSKKAFAMVHPG